VEFKQEIFEKFHKSEMNNTFVFPRTKKAQPLQNRNKNASALSAMEDD
jgi:hypothetical protein